MQRPPKDWTNTVAQGNRGWYNSNFEINSIPTIRSRGWKNKLWTEVQDGRFSCFFFFPFSNHHIKEYKTDTSVKNLWALHQAQTEDVTLSWNFCNAKKNKTLSCTLVLCSFITYKRHEWGRRGKKLFEEFGTVISEEGHKFHFLPWEAKQPHWELWTQHRTPVRTLMNFWYLKWQMSIKLKNK